MWETPASTAGGPGACRYRLPAGPPVSPMAELSYGTIRKVGAGFFDVTTLYRRSHFLSLGIGVRIGLGASMHRMGRYGAAAGSERDGHRMEHP